MTELTPAELMDDDRALFGEEFLEEHDMLTKEEIQALLDRNGFHTDDSLYAAAEGIARTALSALARAEDAEAAVALVVEKAANMIEDNVRHAKELGREIWAMPDLRALAPDAGIKALAELRAERDECKRLMEMRHREMLAADELMRKQQRRAEKAEAEVGALRLQLDQKDALYDSGFQAGVKLGWNFGVSGDEAGFRAATSSTEHVSELRRIRADIAAAGGDA